MREAACEMGKLTKREEGEDLHDSKQPGEIKRNANKTWFTSIMSSSIQQYFDLEKTIKI